MVDVNMVNGAMWSPHLVFKQSISMSVIVTIIANFNSTFDEKAEMCFSCWEVAHLLAMNFGDS